MGKENQALIFSTNSLPGFDQMALDLNSLDQTISNPEIILTLRSTIGLVIGFQLAITKSKFLFIGKIYYQMEKSILLDVPPEGGLFCMQEA